MDQPENVYQLTTQYIIKWKIHLKCMSSIDVQQIKHWMKCRQEQCATKCAKKTQNTPTTKHLTLYRFDLSSAIHLQLSTHYQGRPRSIRNDQVNTSSHPGIHFSRIPISHLHSCRCRRQEVIFSPIKVIEFLFPDGRALNSGYHGLRARSAAALSQLNTLV